MYASRLRASRSAALYAPKLRLTTRSDRFFHSTTPKTAPNGDSDDGRGKPERGNGRSEGHTDDNLFGTEAAIGPGSGQGRRRGPLAPSKARPMRNRSPEQLPPVRLPDAFRIKHIFRYEDHPYSDIANLNSDIAIAEDREAEVVKFLQLATAREPEVWQQECKTALGVACWNKASLKQALEGLRNGNHHAVSRTGNVAAAAAYWLVISTHQMYGDSDKQPARNDFEPEIIPPSHDLYRVIKSAREIRGDQSPTSDDMLRAVKRIVNSQFPDWCTTLIHDSFTEEIISAVSADLCITAPEHVKMVDPARRPVTIIDLDFCKGPTAARDLMVGVASSVKANLLYLTAHDIASIVGDYLREDAARAPGSVSLLGFRAAEHSGLTRTRDNTRDEGDDEDGEEVGSPPKMTINISSDKMKSVLRRLSTSNEELLDGNSRAKPVNYRRITKALDKLLHADDSEPHNPRPLIIHIHDYNAINMDVECGAAIISRIRDFVDDMWLDGRKVVLVGTCSSNDAPKPYIHGIRDLAATERIITVPSAPAETFPQKLDLVKGLDEFDCMRQNSANVEKLLNSLLNPNSNVTHPLVGQMQILRRLRPRSPPNCWAPQVKNPRLDLFSDSWCESVLPFAQVYRIATTIIGMQKHQSGCYDDDFDVLGEAILLLMGADRQRDELPRARLADEHEESSNSRGWPPADVRKTDPRSENHEERLKSSLVDATAIRTTFDDIHAPRATIESVKMLTTLSLIRPEAFSYGVLANDRIPGCLLYGPPGTGKTLLAKAVAKESGANMIEVSAATINNMYVGESEKNVRALFSLARKKEPMVIFIDEADALLGARGSPTRDNGGRRDTINQFLREWDGMNSMKAFIMVATNRPFDLDEAVLRRLPRKLLVDLPLEQDRTAILKIHLKDEVLDETVSLENLAKQTPLYSGSDLKNVCVAAAMAAVKEEVEASEKHTGPRPYEWSKKRVLSARHFDKALREIGASVSEDMATLNAIRKFDEAYGDNKGKRKRKGMGFEVVPNATDADQARIRSTVK